MRSDRRGTLSRTACCLVAALGFAVQFASAQVNGNDNANSNVNGNVNDNVNGNVNDNVNDNVNGNVNGNTNTNVNGNAVILLANPPTDNPYVDGQQPFRDVLQHGPTAVVSQGIGAAGTPPEGSVFYSPITVTFDAPPSVPVMPGSISVQCTSGPCPTVVSVSGAGAGPYFITLSGAVTPGECMTLTFAGTASGQGLQYQSLPGDANLDGFSSTQDLLFLVQRLNDGTANLPENQARYNINRSMGLPPHVNTQDLLRLVQLLNGTNAPEPFNGVSVTECPPLSTGGNANTNVNGNVNGNANENGNLNGNTNTNVNGNVNGNANDNLNGNANANGNLNGNANANDNLNGNANANANVNGNANGNANINGNTSCIGFNGCPNGEFRVAGSLSGVGPQTGFAEYRLEPDRERFRVDVSGFTPGSYSVTLNGVNVGTIFVGSNGSGSLDYDTNDGNFPPSFPTVNCGDIVSVGGGIASGPLLPNCS